MCILPLYPYVRALQALADAGRPDLRPIAIRAVRDELRGGHDGLGEARGIQRARQQTQQRQVPPCAT